MPYAIPAWLSKLPSGEYTLSQLVILSRGKEKSSLQRTLKRLQLEKLYVENNNNRNFKSVKYIWKNEELDK